MEDRLEITIALSAVSMKTHLSSIKSTLLEEDPRMDEQGDMCKLKESTLYFRNNILGVLLKVD